MTRPRGKRIDPSSGLAVIRMVSDFAANLSPRNEQLGVRCSIIGYNLQHGSLPDDDTELAAIVGVDPRTWRARICEVVRNMLVKSGDRLVHPEIDAILKADAARQNKHAQTNRKNIEKRWGNRNKKHTNGILPKIPMVSVKPSPLLSPPSPLPSPPTPPLTNPSSTPDLFPSVTTLKIPPTRTRVANETKPPAAKKTACRLSEDWTPDESGVSFARSLGLDPQSTFDHFRDHFLSAGGPNARKIRWDLTFKNWCREAKRRGPGAGKQANKLDYIREHIERESRGQ